mgnify:CR=1 FL=1
MLGKHVYGNTYRGFESPPLRFLNPSPPNGKPSRKELHASTPALGDDMPIEATHQDPVFSIARVVLRKGCASAEPRGARIHPSNSEFHGCIREGKGWHRGSQGSNRPNQGCNAAAQACKALARGCNARAQGCDSLMRGCAAAPSGYAGASGGCAAAVVRLMSEAYCTTAVSAGSALPERPA